MTEQAFGRNYGGTLAENYERFFVPAIAVHVAKDLIDAAVLRPGERVLDVACGTGVVARLASEAVGASGSVAGLDVDPGMLAVARSVAPASASIDWYEASAEAIPLPDDSFDVVLSQMGLQFIPDKSAALDEMRRTLTPDGRLAINVPGPTPEVFAIMAEGLGTHIHPDCARFPAMVFSLHDADELRGLLETAGFADVEIQVETKTFPVPDAKEFLWQYVYSTPLAEPVAAATDEQRAAAESEICDRWSELTGNGSLVVRVGMTTAVGS